MDTREPPGDLSPPGTTASRPSSRPRSRPSRLSLHQLVLGSYCCLSMTPTDVENPEFQARLDKLVVLNQKLMDIGQTGAPGPLKALQRVPVLFQFVGEILALYLMKPVESGSLDLLDEQEAELVY